MIFMAVSSVMYLGHSWDGSKPLTCLPLKFLAVIGVVWKGNGQRGRVVLLGSFHLNTANTKNSYERS